MKTLLFALSAVILAGAAAMAWQASRDEDNATKAVEKIAVDITRAREAAKHAEARLALVAQTAGDLRRRLQALPGTTTPNANSVRTAANTPGPATPPIAAPSTPEAMEARLADAREKTRNAKSEIANFAAQRVWIVQTYQPMFGALGLSDGQREKFIEIGMRRFERLTDLNALKRENILSAADPAVAKYEEMLYAEEDAAYRNLLGPIGHQRFIEYNRTASARKIITPHAGAAVLAGIPFTPSQLEQIVQVVVNNYTKPHLDRHVYFNWQYDPVDWHTADIQLRPLMSEAQWALFETYAPPGTDMQSRLRSKFNQLVSKAREDDRSVMAAQTAKPPGN